MSTAVKFTKLVYQNTRPTPAFDAWIAVAGVHGAETIIGAPSLDELAERWVDFTGQVLDRARAQHVIIVKNNAPPEMFEAAKRIASTQSGDSKP